MLDGHKINLTDVVFIDYKLPNIPGKYKPFNNDGMN